MAFLIDELKKEHSVLVSMLNKITGFGINSKERLDILFSAKTGLLAHVKKEDSEMYPVLRKASEKDENLKMMLDMFANDMNTISKAAFGFFDKYSQGSLGSELDFAVDFVRLLGLLELRIRKEENILYKEYEKIKV